MNVISSEPLKGNLNKSLHKHFRPRMDYVFKVMGSKVRVSETFSGILEDGLPSTSMYFSYVSCSSESRTISFK